MEPSRHDRLVFPALLRRARNVVRARIRAALAEAGCEDVPRSGSFVLAAIARDGCTPLAELVAELGVTKQAVSQLVDALVLRGYLERTPDPDDRRKMQLRLTDRGVAAAEATRVATERLEAQLVERVGSEGLAAARATLGAIVELGAELGEGDGEPA